MIEKKNSKVFYLFSMLILLGSFSFIYQILRGLSITGLNEPVVWGIYVVNFTLCLSIGACILAFLSCILKRSEVSSKFKLLLSASSFISLSLAGIFILADLGRIDRFYYLVIYPQLHSPLFWDFIALHALLGISMILCFVILREIFIERGLPDKCSNIEKFLYGVVTVGREINIFKLLTIKIVNISLFLLIVLSYFVTTELFMSLKAHPAWNTPLLIPIFFTSSALCGLSVAVILRSFYGDVRDSRDRKLFSSLINKLILFFIIADLALLLIKYITYSSNSLIAQSYSTSPLYFFFLLIIGNIFPILVILLAKHKEVLLYGLLPTLILIGVFLKRADLIIGSYFRRWLPFPDKAFYVPTVWEILVVMGVYSGGIFALVMFFYVLNYLKNKEESAI